MQAGDLRSEVMHPLPACYCAEERSTCDGDGSVEGSEKPASASGRVIVGARQAEQRHILERCRLLDNPSFAADRNAIAGSKGHACTEATPIP